jgi:hypothetical protein
MQWPKIHPARIVRQVHGIAYVLANCSLQRCACILSPSILPHPGKYQAGQGATACLQCSAGSYRFSGCSFAVGSRALRPATMPVIPNIHPPDYSWECTHTLTLPTVDCTIRNTSFLTSLSVLLCHQCERRRQHLHKVSEGYEG